MTISNQAPATKYDPILCDFDLPLEAVYYPRGFAVEIATNSSRVLQAAEESWGLSQQSFSEVPIQVSIAVAEGGPDACPAPPVCRGRRNLVSMVSDPENFSVCDLARGFAFAWITEAVAKNTAFLRYHFLESTTLITLVARHLTPIHAACAALDGKGVLLCGDAGAGKSSLSFACSRAGWTFVADDSCAVVRSRTDRTVVGNPHQIRFRPSAIDLFPELSYEHPVRRMNHELAIELATSAIPEIRTAAQTPVEHVVFLRRQPSGAAKVTRFSQASALAWFEQVICYGEADLREAQRASLRSLLTAGIFELQYSDLDSAVARLETLVKTGG